MADRMKIIARLQGDVAEIRVLVNHPMETGLRKDADGELVPAHFIQTLTATVGGKVVVEAQVGTGVSRNPFFAFKVKGAKLGDEVVITWKDNKGDTRTDTAKIEPQPA
jgi:sulfur-oxidizing protein SoxZ